MVRRKKTNSSSSRKAFLVFTIGALFLIVGITGVIFRSLGVFRFDLADMIDADVSWYGHFQLDIVEKVFPLESLQNSPLKSIEQGLSLPEDFVWKDFVEDDLFMTSYGPDAFLIAFKPKQNGGAKAFIKSLTLEGESVHTFFLNDHRFYSPAYSSFVSAGVIDNYVVVVSSEAIARRVLFPENKLSDLDTYKELMGKSPRRSFGKFFGVSDRLTQNMSESMSTYKPLFDVVSATLPAFMITLRGSEEQLALHVNVKTAEGVFSERQIEKESRPTLPTLAQFAPRDVLFFMNGNDLAFKYNHTKSFLGQFHPQFSLMFEGIMKAESKRVLGDEFDFEKDFLQALGGQYGIIINGIDQENSRLGITLISGLKSYDGEASLSLFHQAVRRAQSAFSTKTQTIELPDGTTRDELVAINPQEITISQQTLNGIEYFTAQGPQADEQFSYALLENNFIFSTHKESMESVLNTYKNLGESESLSGNSDFRESVLFRFSPSESYGYINASQVSNVFTSFVETLSATGEEVPSWVSFISSLGEQVRSVSFARKIQKDQAVMDILLFPQ